MDDIEAGKIDGVVVYKVDRLSRSLLDFARIMGSFDQHGVSFVSVTQQFNTSVPHSFRRLSTAWLRPKPRPYFPSPAPPIDTEKIGDQSLVTNAALLKKTLNIGR